MFQKLISYGISSSFVKFLENMYYKTKLSIRLPRDITNFSSSNIGLKQGCNLSPILFNLFINDIDRIFHENFCQPPSLLKIQLKYLLHSNDLIKISETSLSLQNCLNRLQSYCQKSKLKVNIKKTRTMTVSKRQPSVQHQFTFEN